MTLNFPPAPVAFFALNNRNGTPQLRVYAGGERFTYGTTFGSAETGSTQDLGTCRVISFGGNSSNTLVAMVNGGIYRTTDLGASWTLVHTLTSDDGTAKKTGLHVVYIDGVATICGFYSATSVYRAVKSTDGITWTNVVVDGDAPQSFESAPFSLLTYQNQVWGCISNSTVTTSRTAVFRYDPGGNYIEKFLPGDLPSCTNLSTSGLAVCANNLYVVYRDTSGFLSLARWSSGLFLDKYTSAFSVTGSNTGKWGVWSFTTTSNSFSNPHTPTSWSNTINVLAHRTAGGFGAFVFTYDPDSNTFSELDTTSSVIPQLMTSAGGATTSSGVGVYLDANSNPGAVRDAFVFYYNNVDTNWYLYRWNGPGSRMGKWSDLSQNIPLGVFADARDSLPFVHTVTGVYSAAQQRIEIKSRTYVAGGLRITFTITDGSYPGQLIKVLGFWGTGFMALPNNNMATLSNSSHGNLVNNVIYDLEADTGTEYEVTWLAETDGFANSENFKFVLYALPQ